MSRRCGECDGAMKRFKNETFTVTHADMPAKVERLSGWRCADCGEVAFDTDGARRYATAGDALVLRRRRQERDPTAPWRV